MVKVAGPCARSCAGTGDAMETNKARKAAAIRIAHHYTLRYFVGTPTHRVRRDESDQQGCSHARGTGSAFDHSFPLNRPGGGPMSERSNAGVSRRDLLRLSVGGGAGLAVGGLLDWPAAAAAAGNLKLSDIQEFTTSCNFCSCGCGMIASVRDGKLISMEGDFDHIVNRGSLCVKGISMFATHASP